MTAAADELLDRLTHIFAAARDAARAQAQAAYMREQFAFLGLAAPAQRALSRTVLSGLPELAEADLRDAALGCWRLAEREYQYFACDLLRAHVAVPGPAFLATVRVLLTTRTWWDTVDPLATRVVGGLAQRHPQLVPELDAWSVSDDRWLVRAAILHQLHYGPRTDPARLFGYCSRQAGHRDFFVRKAIGWALRQYARTDPAGVLGFVERERERLAPLSIREATKHL